MDDNTLKKTRSVKIERIKTFVIRFYHSVESFSSQSN
jgi:hypothetical protein